MEPDIPPDVRFKPRMGGMDGAEVQERATAVVCCDYAKASLLQNTTESRDSDARERIRGETVECTSMWRRRGSLGALHADSGGGAFSRCKE